MLLTVLDFESTGLNLEIDQVVEVGAVVYDTTADRILEMWNVLVNPSIQIPKEATAIHGITDDMAKGGWASSGALQLVIDIMDRTEAVAGHGVNRFDKPMLLAWAKRYDKQLPNKLWIDTHIDLEKPGKHLQYMCADEGWLNMFPHTALTDCLSVVKLLSTRDILNVVRRAKQPMVVVKAHVTRDQNPLARKRRYRWNSEHRLWWKSLKEGDVEAEKAEAPFKVTLEEIPVERLQD